MSSEVLDTLSCALTEREDQPYHHNHRIPVPMLHDQMKGSHASEGHSLTWAYELSFQNVASPSSPHHVLLSLSCVSVRFQYRRHKALKKIKLALSIYICI